MIASPSLLKLRHCSSVLCFSSSHTLDNWPSIIYHEKSYCSNILSIFTFTTISPVPEHGRCSGSSYWRCGPAQTYWNHFYPARILPSSWKHHLSFKSLHFYTVLFQVFSFRPYLKIIPVCTRCSLNILMNELLNEHI